MASDPSRDLVAKLASQTVIATGQVRTVRFAMLEDGSYPGRDALISFVLSEETKAYAFGALAVLKYLAHYPTHPRCKPWRTTGVKDLLQVTSGDLRLTLVERRVADIRCLDLLHMFEKHQKKTPAEDVATIKRLFGRLKTEES